MFIFKKEKRVVELALQHIDKTGECLEFMAESVKALVSEGRVEEVAAAANRVSDLESDADKLLRNIRELLYSGAYLPLIRGDIYRLMSAIDNVANKAEDCCEFVNYQKPAIAKEYQAEIIAIVDLTLACYAEFRNALRAFFSPEGTKDTLREHTKKVSELESLIDGNERSMTSQIFASSLPLSDKLHFRGLLSGIVCISDVIEDATDELELVSLKSVV